MGVNSQNFINGQRDFLDAIVRKDEGILTGEYNKGLDLNYYDGLLPHPLVYAIYNDCRLEAFKKLVELGAEMDNQCVLTGTMPIHHAAMMGRLDIVKYLIDKHSKIDLQDQIGRKTPLHYAIENNFLEVVNLLCENDADVNLCDLDGFTPLHMAVESKNFDIVETLLQFGADINVQNKFSGQTPLHLACLSNDFDLIVKLVRRGAKPSIEDIYGVTAIDIEKTNENFVLTKILEKSDGHLVNDSIIKNKMDRQKENDDEKVVG